MTDFRLCSICQSNSQANLCHYTQKLVSVKLEFTFVDLRYFFEDCRPSQTTHLKLLSIN
jgi:hypothetical protein